MIELSINDGWSTLDYMLNIIPSNTEERKIYLN